MMKIKILGRNYKIPKSVKDYLTQKINKHSNFLKKATTINAIITENKTPEGNVRNMKLEINLYLPNAFIKVEERGQNILALIDQVEELLKRRLKRYHDYFKRWSKKNSKFSMDQEDAVFELDEEVVNESILNYSPTIKRKEYENNRPLNPVEAAEMMELIGHSSYLFKNIENGRYAMIYKRSELAGGGYGLVQPKTE